MSIKSAKPLTPNDKHAYLSRVYRQTMALLFDNGSIISLSPSCDRSTGTRQSPKNSTPQTQHPKRQTRRTSRGCTGRQPRSSSILSRYLSRRCTGRQPSAVRCWVVGLTSGASTWDLQTGISFEGVQADDRAPLRQRLNHKPVTYM